MRRCLATSVTWLALVACRTQVYHPPPADPGGGDDDSTTGYTTGTTANVPPETVKFDVDWPVLDVPYPDLPDLECDERTLAGECAYGCLRGPELVAEVCGVPTLGAPAPYHRLLVDCACSNTDPRIADLDGDGVDDIASACPDHNGSSAVFVWYGGPQRPLACPARHSVGPHAAGIAAADVDGDGRRDLLAIHSAGTMLSLLRGRDGREFAPHELIVLAEPPAPDELSNNTHAIVADDLDLDGRVDLIAHDYQHVHVLRGDGLGGFTSGQVLTIQPDCRYPRFHDLDGDGRTDLLVRCTDGTLVAHRNDGLGGFIAAAEPVLQVEGGFGEFTVADLTGDLAPDILFTHQTGLALAAPDGEGKFTGFDLVGPALSAERLAVVDLDGAPGLEIVAHGADINNATAPRITSLLAGDPKQGWSVVATLAHREDVWLSAHGDINGDGRPDLVFGNAISADSNGGMFLLESAP